MNIKNCPSCGAPITSPLDSCAYCGYRFNNEAEKEDVVNLSKSTSLNNNDTQNEKIIVIHGKTLEKGEYPIYSGQANLFRGIFNAAGGHLVLTNLRFLFIDHGLNLIFKVKPEEESIYFDEISDVIPKTVMLFSKRIIVKKKNSTQIEYVVWNLDKWTNAIQNAIPQIKM